MTRMNAAKTPPCNAWLIRLLPGLLLLLPAAAPAGQHLLIEPGIEQAGISLPYGWSHPERTPEGRTFRWIDKLEAEVIATLTPAGDYRLLIEAKPMPEKKRFYTRIQNMGLFVNGHFIQEWLMGEESVLRTYETTVPAARWRNGENRIILRAGYTASAGGDPRRLSIAISRIELDALPPEAGTAR